MQYVFICGDPDELTDDFISAFEKAERSIKKIGLIPISFFNFNKVEKDDIELFENLDEVNTSVEKK